MPQTTAKIMKAIQSMQQERTPEHVIVKSDVLGPEVMEETIEVVQKQVQKIDKTVDVQVVMQRQVLASKTVQKTVEVPQVQFLERAVGVPVATQTEQTGVLFLERTHAVEDLSILNDVPLSVRGCAISTGTGPADPDIQVDDAGVMFMGEGFDAEIHLKALPGRVDQEHGDSTVGVKIA